MKKSLGYHIERFSTNEEWKAARPYGIGSSEVGAIFGVNPFSTPYSVWAHKLGIVDPIEENFAMEMGHAMEYYVAHQFSVNTGIKVIKASEGDWLAIDNEKPYLRVSPDRTYWIPGEKESIYNKGIAECKTSFHGYEEDAIFSEFMSWYCQLQYQLHVMRMKEGYLCFMCLDRMHNGLRWFVRFPYDKDFCENNLIPALDKFWNGHILPARMFLETHNITDPLHLSQEYWEVIHEFAPPAVNASDVAAMYRKQKDGKSVPTSGVKIPDGIECMDGDTIEEILSKRRDIETSIKALDARKKAIDNIIKLYMADAETLVDADGKVVASWKQNKASSKLSESRLMKDHPEIYNEYLETKPGTRMLRFK